MITLLVKALGLVVGAVVIAGSYYIGGKVSITEQLQVYTALRNTSAIVFGVMGAWLAIVFPHALRRAHQSPEGTQSSLERQRIRKLMKPIIIAALIVAITLVFSVVTPLVRQLLWLQQFAGSLRGISYAILILLTFLQIFSLLIAITPADSLRRDHAKAEQRAARKRSYTKLTQRNGKASND